MELSLLKEEEGGLRYFTLLLILFESLQYY